MDLTVVVDKGLPPHIVMVKHTADGALEVSASPSVEVEVLFGLHPEVGVAVADAIDNMPQ